MINAGRQALTPSASAFAVMRLSAYAAGHALVAHLVQNGSIAHTIEAERMVTAAAIESTVVVW